MNQPEITQTTLGLLRSFLTGEPWGKPVSEELLGEVYKLADKHDVAHLITAVPGGRGLLKSGSPFLKARQQAVYRYMTQDHERERIYALFEGGGIPFVPLKGSVIHSYYPESWQRTGCDIDILIHEEDLERAVELLQEKYSYRPGKKSEHDISLMSPAGVHLELHYDLHEEEVPVEEVWADARPIRPGSSHLVLSGELFLFHHIAHMAKHFRIGGCGLRPLMDLWLLRQHMPYDRAELERKLSAAGLKVFSDNSFALLDYWFGDGEATAVVEKMAEYILPAGAYGSMENRVAIGQIKKGSKVQYFKSRLFQTRAALEYPYPALKKHGWLLPFCQVHRWIKLLADGKSRRILRELKANGAMERGYRDDVAQLMELLRLDGREPG